MGFATPTLLAQLERSIACLSFPQQCLDREGVPTAVRGWRGFTRCVPQFPPLPPLLHQPQMRCPAPCTHHRCFSLHRANII